MRRRTVVAMSGGVDSSVAAALLAEAGHEVIGIAMRLAPDHRSREQSQERSRACCSYEDFEDARRVAERVGFPFYVIDLRDEFEREVIAPFVDDYANGRTPNPCLNCNRHIKFDRLAARARELDADFVATGHYARIERDEAGRFHLLCGVDTTKDQSYFLYALDQRGLARTLFPLGSLTKDEVRRRARALELLNADKPESQEICFVPHGGYAHFVEQRIPESARKAGAIVDDEGIVVGRHSGIHRFTVGQRRGLGVAGGTPLYVREIRPDTGEVVVSRREALRVQGLEASGVNFINPDLIGPAEEVVVKLRYRHQGVRGIVRWDGGSRVRVDFPDGAPSVTPGQACVFYRGEEVLGGATIERPLR